MDIGLSSLCSLIFSMRYFDRAALFIESCLKYGVMEANDATNILPGACTASLQQWLDLKRSVECSIMITVPATDCNYKTHKKPPLPMFGYPWTPFFFFCHYSLAHCTHVGGKMCKSSYTCSCFFHSAFLLHARQKRWGYSVQHSIMNCLLKKGFKIILKYLCSVFTEPENT